MTVALTVCSASVNFHVVNARRSAFRIALCRRKQALTDFKLATFCPCWQWCARQSKVRRCRPCLCSPLLASTVKIQRSSDRTPQKGCQREEHTGGQICNEDTLRCCDGRQLQYAAGLGSSELIRSVATDIGSLGDVLCRGTASGAIGARMPCGQGLPSAKLRGSDVDVCDRTNRMGSRVPTRHASRAEEPVSCQTCQTKQGLGGYTLSRGLRVFRVPQAHGAVVVTNFLEAVTVFWSESGQFFCANLDRFLFKNAAPFFGATFWTA